MNSYLASLLLTHFICNAQAAVQPVSPEEALRCSRNFETLKFYLHPQMTSAEAAKMSSAQRAKKSVEAYAFYVAWKKANPELVAHLKETSDRIIRNPQDSAEPGRF
ncbi:MAG: hypothetical protein AAF724_22160 [Pseudomonadota bacterium]